ncbi:MAG: hypothetical protein IT288_05660 [Bdellovibrionales bacterium]|nr:hypothetical protein [Bdellovibrionales bacterium]
MILVEVSLSTWCDKYGLTVEQEPCVKCGKLLVADVPVALSGYRGLKSQSHDCGKEYDHFVLVPIKEEETEWRKIK